MGHGFHRLGGCMLKMFSFLVICCKKNLNFWRQRLRVGCYAFKRTVALNLWTKSEYIAHVAKGKEQGSKGTKFIEEPM